MVLQQIVKKVFKIDSMLKSVDMIALFDSDGAIKPIRFKICNKQEDIIISVLKSIKIESEKIAGNYMEVFDCQSIINERMRNYRLKYEKDTCKWFIQREA